MTNEKKLIDVQTTLYNSKNPTRKWLHCTRRDWIIDAIKEFSFSGMKVIEVGPGSGLYLDILAEQADSVTAIDIELAYLEYIEPQKNKLSNLELVQDDITQSKLEKNTYDLILCTEVIEHIQNSPSALENMFDLLKPGGRLILSTPQRYSPLELTAKVAFLPGFIQLVRLIYGEAIEPTGHINLMTEKVMKSQLVNAGFKIERQFKSGVYLPVLAECGGKLTLSIEKWLEKKAQTSILHHLLWTQYYIAKKDEHP
jgi:2-polyprenyl-3-methyl-5-hydroxy-6-metoxy-1,4-benzoquinol methylase